MKLLKSRCYGDAEFGYGVIYFLHSPDERTAWPEPGSSKEISPLSIITKHRDDGGYLRGSLNGYMGPEVLIYPEAEKHIFAARRLESEEILM